MIEFYVLTTETYLSADRSYLWIETLQAIQVLLHEHHIRAELRRY